MSGTKGVKRGTVYVGFKEFKKGRSSSNSKILPTAMYRTVSRQFISSKMKSTKVSLDDDPGVGPLEAEGIRNRFF